MSRERHPLTRQMRASPARASPLARVAARAVGPARTARATATGAAARADVSRWARARWSESLRAGDACVDATLGRGRDALEMARLTSHGVVYGFDVERDAIEASRAAFAEAGWAGRLRAERRCHAEGLEALEAAGLRGTVGCVTFNLGYLPGDDAATRRGRTRTAPATTTRALASACRLTREGGCVTVVAYVGHEGGAEECEAVRAFVSTLPSREWVVTERRVVNRRAAPVLFEAERVSSWTRDS